MPPDEIDPRGSVFSWDKPTDQRHRFRLKQYHGHILEVEDLHFHTDSAVMMPNYEAGTSHHESSERTPITGLAVLRACYLHAQENPSQLIIIAGHTDTRGRGEYNKRLSRLRAENILHALLGDRDGWVKTAQKKHRVEDYKQILQWVARMWGWNCDPVKVDNQLTPQTRRAILAFQIAYNKKFKASIAEDKVVGPQTWGAFFDVYMDELMYILETDQAGLHSLRAHLKFLDESCKFVGCGEAFPIEAPREDEYESHTNRRVEILFFDPGEAPQLTCASNDSACSPKNCMIYNPKIYSFNHIHPEPVPMLVWLDLQTVDEFGCSVPNISLKLTPEYGKELDVSTNNDSYWSGRVRVDGKIEVRTADGKPVRFGASLEDGTPSGGLADTVVIVPRVAPRTVTDIIVPTLSQQLIKKRRKQVKRYGRTPAHGRRTARSAEPSEHDGEKAGKSHKRGGKVEKFTRRTVGEAVADNLFIAAGWGNDSIDRLSKYLYGWLKDHHPTAISRGYFLEIVIGQKLLIYTEKKGGNGDQYEAKAVFEFMPDIYMKGRAGAHAPFEYFGVTGNMLFTDMQSASSGLKKGIAKKRREDKADSKKNMSQTELKEDLTKPPEDIDTQKSPKETPHVEIWEVVEKKNAQACRDLLYRLHAEGRIEILYNFPKNAQLLIYIARCGGTGLLEDYPGHESLNDSIHKRNLEVAKNIAAAYEIYLDDYVKKVKKIDPDIKKAKTKGLPHPEIQLYQLGPPDSSFMYPKPAGCTMDQYREIAYKGSASALPAWRAISQKLDDIWKIRSEGSIWMVFEFSAEAGEYAGPLSGCNVKVNFEADDRGRITPLKFTRTFSLKASVKGSEMAVEHDPDTGKTKAKAKIDIGIYGVEADTDGNVKFNAGVAFSEYNYMTAQVGAGIELSLKDQLKKHYQKKGQKPPEWVDKLPDLKFKVGLYMQLVRESTIMKIVSGAPGFWQMRPRSEFVTLDWASLDFDEQYHLKILDWNQDKWDFKMLPKTALTPYTHLTAKKKSAAIHLPVPAFDPYWQEFWLNDFRKAKRTSKQVTSDQPSTT